MRYARTKRISNFFTTFRTLICFVLLNFTSSRADESYSFDLDEFEKKSFEWGGYVEGKWEHMRINQGSFFSSLNLPEDVDSSLDRLTGSLLLGGKYNRGSLGFNWRLKAFGRQDALGWSDKVEIYEVYTSVNPTSRITFGAGKKSYKWGKGYAWNPVGFLNRRKDPNNPDEELEGFSTVETDLIKSFHGALQNFGLTVVLLPVWDSINKDFGRANYINLATKLSILYKDTDIDFLYFTGHSRSSRLGVDFSKNLASNFELHGELAYISNRRKTVLQKQGSFIAQEISAFSALLGCRYLFENDITSIIEYYYNGTGYEEDELGQLFQSIEDGSISELDKLHDSAESLSLDDYGSPNPGQNYLYIKINYKEPFDILYLKPGITAIINLDDSSSSITPEIIYNSFTNWELRLRFTHLNGGDLTEYGEKQNQNKLELRLRYFF